MDCRGERATVLVLAHRVVRSVPFAGFRLFVLGLRVQADEPKRYEGDSYDARGCDVALEASIAKHGCESHPQNDGKCDGEPKAHLAAGDELKQAKGLVKDDRKQHDADGPKADGGHEAHDEGGKEEQTKEHGYLTFASTSWKVA